MVEVHHCFVIPRLGHAMARSCQLDSLTSLLHIAEGCWRVCVAVLAKSNYVARKNLVNCNSPLLDPPLHLTYCAFSCSFLALMAKLALRSSKYFVFRKVGSLTFLSNMHPHAKSDIVFGGELRSTGLAAAWKFAFWNFIKSQARSFWTPVYSYTTTTSSLTRERK
jgi:hypothetical protein